MKKLLFALVALALGAGLATATVPDPTNCQVVPCDALGPVGQGGVVVCPDYIQLPPGPGLFPINAANVTVTVKNAAGNIISGATIQVTFGSAIINACPPGLPWNGATNGSGVWQKNFNAGGCLSAANACVISANGTIIRTYTNVKSPDWDGGAGNRVLQGNDFSSFLAAYTSGGPGCHDYDNNLATNLGDFIIFAGGFNPSHQCAP